MALICFASAKGSPGSTLTALAVAAAWPTSGDRRKLLLEADASGGTLALRYGLGLEPGLVTFAVAAQRRLEPEALWNHAQTLPGGLPAIVGPDNPDRASAVLTSAANTLGRWFAAQDDIDVIVDLGRLDRDPPSLDLMGHADMTLMVARPCVEQLQPAAHRLRSLPIPSERLGWVLIGDQPHGAEEVEAAFDFAVAGVIALDQRGARALESGGVDRRLRRTALARTASALAHGLADQGNDGPPQAKKMRLEVVRGGASHGC